MALSLDRIEVVDANGTTSETRVVLEDRKIKSIGADAPPQGDVIDGNGFIALPGFIDIHTHGGGGFELHTSEPEQIRSYADWAASTGVTSFLIAAVGTPGRIPDVEIETAVKAIESSPPGARPLGIHLEGPYINPARRGAHPTDWLRSPSPDETEQVLDLAQGHLRVVTLAPELPGALEMIRRLVNAGVTVSLGHTDATFQQALDGFAAGASQLTHCFNAMPPLLHRAPGPLGALVEIDRAMGELICDGVHVEPAAMKALVNMLGSHRVIAITDALPAAGKQAGPFSFNGQPAHVEGGVARLADGTITGSVLTMDQALRNLIRYCGVSLSQASAMCSRNPAVACGVADHKGLLLPGYDADLVMLDRELKLVATIRAGEVIYATEGWHSRILPTSRRNT
ncbi:MAG TPA: N-acetylglucosamine-6-phosphate deacetylase [Thermomicrobiaceae bacterium]|nr:N-acetylglucosamine-6-phosphate deacetylase [Thermomicrobiaceae bacterium]